MNPDSNKQLITFSGLHPAISSVISNDDLLIEILVRLPIIPLLSFKRVSKHWLSLIQQPAFTFRRGQIPKTDPSTGLYLKCSDSAGYGLFLFKSSRFLEEKFCRCVYGDIIQSCNVLLLCSRGENPDNKNIVVLNPVTLWSQKFLECGYERYRIAFDPSKSLCYKLFRVVMAGMRKIVVVVYSSDSETDEWSICPVAYPAKCFLGFGYGVYWNDAIHWLNIQFGEQPSHYKFGYVNEHPVLTQVQLPKLHRKLHWDIKIFTTGGSLVLICWDYENSNLLGIYEMKKNGGSDWLFKYFVDLKDVLKAFGRRYWRIRGNVMSIVVGEREEDSFMVIELAGQVIEYKFKLKLFRSLCGLGSHCPKSCFEFIASFVDV